MSATKDESEEIQILTKYLKENDKGYAEYEASIGTLKLKELGTKALDCLIKLNPQALALVSGATEALAALSEKSTPQLLKRQEAIADIIAEIAIKDGDIALALMKIHPKIEKAVSKNLEQQLMLVVKKKLFPTLAPAAIRIIAKDHVLIKAFKKQLVELILDPKNKNPDLLIYLAGHKDIKLLLIDALKSELIQTDVKERVRLSLAEKDKPEVKRQQETPTPQKTQVYMHDMMERLRDRERSSSAAVDQPGITTAPKQEEQTPQEREQKQQRDETKHDETRRPSTAIAPPKTRTAQETAPKAENLVQRPNDNPSKKAEELVADPEKAKATAKGILRHFRRRKPLKQEPEQELVTQISIKTLTGALEVLEAANSTYQGKFGKGFLKKDKESTGSSFQGTLLTANLKQKHTNAVSLQNYITDKLKELKELEESKGLQGFPINDAQLLKHANAILKTLAAYKTEDKKALGKFSSPGKMMHMLEDAEKAIRTNTPPKGKQSPTF